MLIDDTAKCTAATQSSGKPTLFIKINVTDTQNSKFIPNDAIALPLDKSTISCNPGKHYNLPLNKSTITCNPGKYYDLPLEKSNITCNPGKHYDLPLDKSSYLYIYLYHSCFSLSPRDGKGFIRQLNMLSAIYIICIKTGPLMVLIITNVQY